MNRKPAESEAAVPAEGNDVEDAAVAAASMNVEQPQSQQQPLRIQRFSSICGYGEKSFVISDHSISEESSADLR